MRSRNDAAPAGFVVFVVSTVTLTAVAATDVEAAIHSLPSDSSGSLVGRKIQRGGRSDDASKSMVYAWTGCGGWDTRVEKQLNTTLKEHLETHGEHIDAVLDYCAAGLQWNQTTQTAKIVVTNETVWRQTQSYRDFLHARGIEYHLVIGDLPHNISEDLIQESLAFAKRWGVQGFSLDEEHGDWFWTHVPVSSLPAPLEAQLTCMGRNNANILVLYESRTG